MLTATPERRSHDYVRHGTTSLFAGLDTLTGKVIGASIADTGRSSFGRSGSAPMPRCRPSWPSTSSSTTTPPTSCRRSRCRLAAPPPPVREPLHAHRRIVAQPRRALVRGADEREDQARAHTSVPNLEGDIRGWLAIWNEHPRPFVWVKTADQILASLARYCERISDSADKSKCRNIVAQRLTEQIATQETPRLLIGGRAYCQGLGCSLVACH